MIQCILLQVDRSTSVLGERLVSLLNTLCEMLNMKLVWCSKKNAVICRENQLERSVLESHFIILFDIFQILNPNQHREWKTDLLKNPQQW